MNLFNRVRQIAVNSRLLKSGIHTSYLICAPPRCGSTMLCEALKNTSVAGYPKEYFSYHYDPGSLKRWGIPIYSDRFQVILRKGTTPNGVFGAKMMWDNIRHVVSEARKVPKYSSSDGSVEQLFSAVFPNLHYVRLTRRDKVRQAVSWYRALRSNVRQSDKTVVPRKSPTFNFESINALYYRLIANEAAWDEYFAKCGIVPFGVVYEDFVARYEDTVKDILGFLKIPIPKELETSRRKMSRMSDEITEEWVERHHKIKGRSRL